MAQIHLEFTLALAKGVARIFSKPRSSNKTTDAGDKRADGKMHRLKSELKNGKKLVKRASDKVHKLISGKKNTILELQNKLQAQELQAESLEKALQNEKDLAVAAEKAANNEKYEMVMKFKTAKDVNAAIYRELQEDKTKLANTQKAARKLKFELEAEIEAEKEENAAIRNEAKLVQLALECQLEAHRDIGKGLISEVSKLLLAVDVHHKRTEDMERECSSLDWDLGQAQKDSAANKELAELEIKIRRDTETKIVKLEAQVDRLTLSVNDGIRDRENLQQKLQAVSDALEVAKAKQADAEAHADGVREDALKATHRAEKAEENAAEATKEPQAVTDAKKKAAQQLNELQIRSARDDKALDDAVGKASWLGEKCSRLEKDATSLKESLAKASKRANEDLGEKARLKAAKVKAEEDAAAKQAQLDEAEEAKELSLNSAQETQAKQDLEAQLNAANQQIAELNLKLVAAEEKTQKYPLERRDSVTTSNGDAKGELCKASYEKMQREMEEMNADLQDLDEQLKEAKEKLDAAAISHHEILMQSLKETEDKEFFRDLLKTTEEQNADLTDQLLSEKARHESTMDDYVKLECKLRVAHEEKESAQNTLDALRSTWSETDALAADDGEEAVDTFEAHVDQTRQLLRLESGADAEIEGSSTANEDEQRLLEAMFARSE